MSTISVGEAFGAGFRLIRREPVAFLAWCVVTFVLYGLPQALISSTTLSAVTTLGSGDAGAAELQRVQAQMMRYQPLSYLSALAMLLVLPPAVFRAVLRPEERGFQFLKIGAAEFWTLMVTLVITIAWLIAMFVTLIPIFVVAAIAGAAGGDGATATAGIAFLLVIPAFGASLWVVLRLSLAPVMAFADRTFRLPESWRLTKGHAWRLFAVSIALLVLMLLVEMVVVGVGFGAVAALGGFEAFAASPIAVLRSVGVPWLVAGLLVWSVVVTVIYVVWMAAWADIYRQLRPADFAETFA